jgi:hypothetical protein
MTVTIKLSVAEENELAVKISEGLEATVFKNGFVFVTDFRWADKVFADLPEDARSKIDRYVGEKGLARFLESEIQARLDRLPTHVTIAKNDRAARIPFLQNPLPFAREIIATLRKLPIRYRATVALPSVLSEFLGDEVDDCITLPAGVSIAKGGSLPDNLQIFADSERVDQGLFNDFIESDDVDRSLRNDLLYLSIPLNGYAYAKGASSLARYAEDHVRAFFGAGIAIGFLDHLWQREGIPKEHRFIMIHDELTKKILATESQEEELYARRTSCSTADFAERHKQDLWQEYQSTLKTIGTIYTENTDCRKLFAACIWFYRAKMNRRPLDALLQATIAIEVMLGDRRAAEGIGLTNLLESRCAYLLGRSLSARAKIAADFRRVYDLRSQVVHEGRHTLKTGDRETVNTALRLCARIISQELTIRGTDDKA